MSYVYQEKWCEYFLVKNFSEDDNEDEIARNSCYEIKKNYIIKGISIL